MSRTVLWILALFLSLAMIALVGVQAYWIKHAVDTKEQQLGLVVNQVLGEISNELIQNETVMAILDEIKPPVITHQSKAVWNFHMDARSAYSGPGMVNEPDSFQIVQKSLKNQKVKMVDDSVLLILGEDEMLHDTILVSAMNPENIRMQLSESWKEQEDFVEKIVRQMLVESGSIEERLSASQIEKILSLKLQEKGVDMPFEYAVYEEGKPPFFQSGSFNEYEKYQYYRAALLPGRIFHRPTFISVFFPDERKYILKSIGIMGGTSMLITLFILTLFSLSLFIIFRQKRLSEMKNDFVNNMTHELKTPISTISLASQMLSDKSIPDAQKNLGQISKIIQAESKQLGFQVERVLQMAIFDHGQLRLKIEELNLHDLIETLAQNFLIQLDRRGGKLEFLPEAENAVVRGDAMHLTNVVSNLMENAMKYTRQEPRIRVSTYNEQGFVVISVQDNGIGISKEDQKRIFDKFYRVPTGNVHNVKGFGLGLSYVKLIVEEHHGSIGVKSEPGKGSRFDIHLPLQEA
jgi:two-component system phosphate regulon sensor histidine kinase PhoR